MDNVQIFVYTYTCNDMRTVMLQINEYDDDDDDLVLTGKGVLMLIEFFR